MPRKRTISFSKNTLVSLYKASADILADESPIGEALRSELLKRIDATKTMISMFKAMANILEENSEFAENLRSELIKRIDVPRKSRIEIVGFFEKNAPKENIRKQLDEKTLEELVSIVNTYSFDQTKTIGKLKDRQKIIEFILERRNNLVNRYQGF